MDVVLAWCGKKFSAADHDDDKYGLSQRVNEIDIFLSHDWGTNRRLKVLTLLLYFNSVPAAVASLLVCLLVCILILEFWRAGWWGHLRYFLVCLRGRKYGASTEHGISGPTLHCSTRLSSQRAGYFSLGRLSFQVQQAARSLESTVFHPFVDGLRVVCLFET